MKILRDTHGDAMIEISLILPILILMLVAVIDIGLVLEQMIGVVDSARVGAEYATTYVNSTNIPAMQTFALNAAQNIPNFSSIHYTVSAPIVSCSCTAGGTATSCSSTCAGVAPAQYAQVTVSASIPLIFGIAGFPTKVPVQSTVKVRTAWTAGN